MLKRPEFKIVKGWIRATEVTRGKDDSAHPHFHVLLFVPPSYFTKYYVKAERWTELWKEVLRIDYLPSVDIRVVKSAESAAAEVLKYTTKPSDILHENHQWTIEYMLQTHKLRFIASGGILKDILKEPESDEEMIHIGDESPDQKAPRLAFTWRGGTVRKYRRARDRDVHR